MAGTPFESVPIMVNRNASESFCDCFSSGPKLDGVTSTSCNCGEEDTTFEWTWDINFKSWASLLQEDCREVRFHRHYSSGTAAVRGTKPLSSGQHFWEVKMLSPVYGTDMMIGVGTGEMDFHRNRTSFCSLLGADAESWGLSYTGIFHHNNRSFNYSTKFGQGTIIGCHLDMWNGTLSFYKNRKPLGIAARNLNGKVLFPMLSSTAARSSMKVITCRSMSSSLVVLCCQALRKAIPNELSVLDSCEFPPGLRKFLENSLYWMLIPCSQVHRCRKTPGRGHREGSRSTNPLFAITDKFLEDDAQQPGTSGFLSPHMCSHLATFTKRRRNLDSRKDSLIVNLMDLSSSDESDSEERADFKRKH